MFVKGIGTMQQPQQWVKNFPNQDHTRLVGLAVHGHVSEKIVPLAVDG
jgi:hypothetical protein